MQNFHIDNDTHFEGTPFSFAAGPKNLKDPIKYKNAANIENYSVDEISAYITGIEGFVHFDVPLKSQIGYIWEWKDEDDYIRLGIFKNEKNALEIPAEINCNISILLSLWEVLAREFPSIYIKDSMDDKIYSQLLLWRKMQSSFLTTI